MQKTTDAAELSQLARRMRRTAIEMITEAKSGHPGGSLSVAEIIVTLFFDVLKSPTVGSVRTLEAALRTVERTYPWNANGVMFTVSWGPHYFEKVLKVTSPIPHPQQLSDFEYPIFDGYDVCIHLASDNEKILVAIQNALAQPSGTR